MGQEQKRVRYSEEFRQAALGRMRAGVSVRQLGAGAASRAEGFIRLAEARRARFAVRERSSAQRAGDRGPGGPGA